MGYNVEGYRKYTGDERVSHLLRSIVQDGCHDFDEDTIKPIFTDKIVNGKQLYGTIARKWMKKLLGSLSPGIKKANATTIVQLVLSAWVFYKKGKNLDEYEIWHVLWMKKAFPLFMEKINSLPGTGSVASMDTWEKPGKKEKIEEWYE